MSQHKTLAFFFAVVVLASCGSSNTKQEEAPQTPEYVQVKAGLYKALKKEPHYAYNNCRDSVCVRYEVITREEAQEWVESYPSDAPWINTHRNVDPNEIKYMKVKYSFDECDDDGKYRMNPEQRLQSTTTSVNAFILYTALPIPEATWHDCEYFVMMPTESTN